MSAHSIRPVRTAAGRVTSVIVLVATLVVAALVLGGCSGGGSSGAPQVASYPADGAADTADHEAAPAGGSDMSEAGGERHVARTASITINVSDANAAAARIRELTASREGYVTRESVSIREAGGGKTSSTIVVSIPTADLDAFLADVAEVGTVQRREVTADDVTTAVVDVEARIRTLRASIERIGALMERAGTVTEIAQVETELSKRQADLESLLAQQKHLTTITERAGVRISLVSAPVDTTNPFWSGLLGGWDALGASARGLLVIIGAVLPFAVVLLVVGVPIAWLVARRRRSTTHPATSAGSNADQAKAADAESTDPEKAPDAGTIEDGE